MNRNNTKKKCIACKSIIPLEANFCKHCSSFQKAWMNKLKYISGIIGLVTASLALITFSISNIPAVMKTIFLRSDLKILEFATNEKIVLANTGNTDVVVTNISLKIENTIREVNPSRIWSVGKELKSGSVLIHQTIDEKEIEVFRKYNLVAYNEIDRKDNKKTPLLERQWNWVFEKALWPVQDHKCFVFVVFYKKDPKLLQYKQFSPELKTLPTSAEIQFYSYRLSQMFKKNFEAEAIVFRKVDDKLFGEKKDPCRQKW